jgi:Cyclin, C-terminal domain
MRHDILELSRFLTELSVIDYYFVSHRPSDIAMSAILNAMELIPSIPEALVQSFLQDVTSRSCLDVQRAEIVECQQRLRLLYAQGGYSHGTEMSAANVVAFDCRNESISPVCVSYGVRTGEQEGAVCESSNCPGSDLTYCQGPVAP